MTLLERLSGGEPRSEGQNLLVEVGTGAGVRVRGRLAWLGGGRLVDVLNQWVDPVVTLAQPTLDSGERGVSAVLPRHEIVWIRPLEPERGYGDVLAHVKKIAKPVLLHAGPFQVRGLAHTFEGVRWADFVLGLGQQFFPLTKVVAGSASMEQVEVPFLAVNAGRVTALVALDEG